MIAPIIYPESKYYWSDTRTMVVRLGIVPNALSCGVVAARRTTRRPWIGTMIALIAPPLLTAASGYIEGNVPAVRARVEGKWASNKGQT